jgi:hypothetical protein
VGEMEYIDRKRGLMSLRSWPSNTVSASKID